MDNVGGEEGDGEMNGERSLDAYTLAYGNRQPMGICSVTRGTLTGGCAITSRGGN